MHLPATNLMILLIADRWNHSHLKTVQLGMIFVPYIRLI